MIPSIAPAEKLVYNQNRIPLRCTCGQCTAPFGYLVLVPGGYALMIESKHHGETHANIIPLLVAPEVAPK